MAPTRKTEPETSKKGRTSSKLFVPACYSFGFLLVCLIAFLLQIVYFSPISPVLDEVPQPAVLSATQLQVPCSLNLLVVVVCFFTGIFLFHRLAAASC